MSDSLADQLRDDLGSSSDESDHDGEKADLGDDNDNDHNVENDNNNTNTNNHGDGVDEIQPEFPKYHTSGINSDDMINNDDVIAHIPKSLMSKLNELQMRSNGSSASSSTPNDEHSDVVIGSAATIGEIDECINALHARLISAYGPGFPELETIVVNGMDYARIVLLSLCHPKNNNILKFSTHQLAEILPSASVITVQVTASSSVGRSLSSKEQQIARTIAQAMYVLDERRAKLLSYVETNAISVAPNLVHVVGAIVSAQLIAQAGGLKPLACMPSGNLKVLGKSQNNQINNKEGFIHKCPIVMQLPLSMRRKAGDIVAGKAALAARVDAQKSSRDGYDGKMIRNALDEKFQKMQQRPPAKSAKPLPVPGDESKRRHRGGARARKEKERLGLTEAWKLSNRLKFGVAETQRGNNDLENEGLGMLGAPDSQRVKLRTTKAAGISLAAKKKLEKQKKREGKSEAERLGITSSLLLTETPVPQMQQTQRQQVQQQQKQEQSQNPNIIKVPSDTESKPNYFDHSTPFLGVQKADRQISKK